MKWLFIISPFIVAACSGFAGQKKNHQGGNVITKKISGSFSSFAVLELFTSEGCSSCPPADRLLPQLAAENKDVIPLSFHVDYWNHLGWTDPFSRAEFSDRQREYGRQFRLESIYTPQLIINGEFEMVGSNKSTAETDIKNVLKNKAEVEVKVEEVRKENNKLSIDCILSGNTYQTDVMVALVQKHAEMKIKGGENRGAKLSHTNVVRSFSQQPAQKKMQFEVDVPKDLAEDNMLIIVYTRKENSKITGAAVWESGQ
jgi:hypothetical protein